MISLILQALGATTAFAALYKVYSFINLYFLTPSTIKRYLQPEGKSYALVTGASDGIGLATAKALQKRGFHLILHGRNREKLERIAAQLGRDTAIAVGDASDPATAVPAIAAAVDEVQRRGGTLKVLVNNVGGGAIFGIPTYTALADMPPAIVRKALDLNANFPTLLTRALLPRLLAAQPGLVVNVGSYAGAYPFPYLTIYAPSKALNHNFSASLSAEMRLLKQDVEVLGILVGPVKTSGNPDNEVGFGVLAGEDMAEAILARVGCGEKVCAGSWRHSLLGEPMRWLPDSLADNMLGKGVLERKEIEEKGK